ncbi:hypothetical protein ACSBR1_036071 [Camellia fascicularis]
MQWVVPENAKDVMDWWRGIIWGKLETKIWDVIPFAVLWSIWTMRNGCIFNGKQHILEEACDLIKLRVALWMKAIISELQYAVHDVSNAKGLNYAVYEIVANLKQEIVLVCAASMRLAVAWPAAVEDGSGLHCCSKLNGLELVKNYVDVCFGCAVGEELC